MSGVAGTHAVRARGLRATSEGLVNGPVVIFAIVFVAQFSFGAWMAARGFQWGDAFYRSVSALFVLHGADPKLANIGFVWMPLPTLLNLPWAALTPFWPDIVASGVSSAATSAVCGGATAAVLLITAKRLGLPRWLGWTYALVISTNPMLFVYGGTGMAEGVAAPFLIGAVCFLTLFWRSGERWWVAAAGVCLGLATASMYEAVPFAAALFAALVGALFWSSEARPAAPQGKPRAVEGLGLLLLVPSAFVGVMWVIFNGVIMGQPLYFLSGAYGYASYNAKDVAEGGAAGSGDVIGVLGVVAERIWPALIPLAALLVLRAVDRRLARIGTVSLIALALSVTLLLVAPMAYLGTRMEFLRYYATPLYAAAGWGLYEIAMSKRRRRAIGIVLAGWIVAAPACVWVMVNPALGTQERPELKALVEGRDALEMGYGDPVVARARLAHYLDTRILSKNGRVLLDSYQGAALAAQVNPSHARLLVMTFDRRFRAALADPNRQRISYVLLPDPRNWPQDALNRSRPRLWAGQEPGFQLAKEFDPGPEFRLPESWRLYAVRQGVRVLPSGAGGVG
ncbi:hypothetical protein [Candidatus Solirubrobacter pratensis]|uniref:hypothetical protein n=1 Tax=Candidatus Solirubrobacter pratensis TaxID=1298857 RepID=UPI00041F0932|nr:hypothetical protein [Candidatus Solirubrobacter pratensis]